MKLTPKMLKRLIAEEAEKLAVEAKFGEMTDTEDAAKDTDEVDADGYADTLDKHIDYVKALKIEEARLMKRVRQVREARQQHLKKIITKI